MACDTCGKEMTQEQIDAQRNEGVSENFECPNCRCDRCGKKTPHSELNDYFECKSCQENQEEAAYERSLSDYYGGSTPQTIDEQHRAAWAQKRGL